MMPAGMPFPILGDFVDPAVDSKGNAMARSNYKFEKRQKELARKKKKEEKRQRKLEDKAAETAENAESDESDESENDSEVPPEDLQA